MKYEELVAQIHGFVEGNPLNRASDLNIEQIFALPLVGTASAGDPFFLELKDPGVVGEHHLLPTEWLKGARTVISYFLPFTERVTAANHIPGLPAEEWLYGRIEGEEFNRALRQFISDLIREEGGSSVAPLLDSRYNVVENRSNWSERHVAFIAGLGTFSLSKSLITEKGCAGRYGSVIIDLPMSLTHRKYRDIYEYCNFCGECIERCPSKAITTEEKDVSVCAHYINTEIIPRYKPRYGCGKCQTSVPCEDKIP